MPDTDPRGATPPGTKRSAALIAIYAVLAGWLFYQDATSWPREGSWALLGYALLVPGILFQATSLAYAEITGRPLARRVLTRLVTIPLGIVLAAVLGRAAGALAMGGFELAYAPFVAELHSGLADACAGGGKYFAISSVAAYNERTGSRPTALLHHDGKRFVLGFTGGSIDIDGSTLYYDSGARAWRSYHNDNPDARDRHQKLLAGLTGCKLRAGQ